MTSSPRHRLDPDKVRLLLALITGVQCHPERSANR
jgi:hypothetical protein